MVCYNFSTDNARSAQVCTCIYKILIDKIVVNYFTLLFNIFGLFVT